MDISSLPVAWANYLSIAGFLFLLGLVWMIPKKIIYTDAPDNARWRDMRWWATVLIFMQITIYITFS